MHNSRDSLAVTRLLSRIQNLGYLMFHVDRVDSVGTVYEIAFVHERTVQAASGGKVHIESATKAGTGNGDHDSDEE